jgi:hypothetical protein
MAPVITSLSAAPQGTNQGSYGQTLTVNGTGMQGTTSAKIGTRTVTATANVGGTVATCTIPSSCGVANVTVTATSGTSNPLPFYYIDPPSLSDLTPTEGSAETPSAIVISGSTLLTTNRVQISAVTATLTPPTSDAQVQATPAAITPLGSTPWTQFKDVSVRTAGGSVTLANALTFYDTSTIGTLVPNAGAAGTEVIINGTAFVGSAISVTFGGVDAEILGVNSDLQILAVAPTGPTGAAGVVVTTLGGASDPVTFTYP